MRVLAAIDKFRGTLSAAEAAAAVCRGVGRVGGTCEALPLADGGDGTLDVLGGGNRQTVVMGPLGDPVDAAWRLTRRTAIIEMARASGLALVGGSDGNDPVAATTHGTGELIATALEAGAKRVLVGMGGSATTDGGLGAIRAMWNPVRIRGVELVVACDVRTRFLDAAEVFAPQKGATPAQVKLLTRRLERLVQVYADDYGIDVTELDGGGAAGGLAGGLRVLGASLVSGFDLVADELDLADRIGAVDVVVTGEGFVDAQSFDGKVVGGVAALAAAANVPVIVVAGEVFDDACAPMPVLSLVERFGRERALADAAGCVEEAVAACLRRSG
jgi:glycerate kinase